MARGGSRAGAGRPKTGNPQKSADPTLPDAEADRRSQASEKPRLNTRLNMPKIKPDRGAEIKQTGRGGARAGAGRPPGADPLAPPEPTATPARHEAASPQPPDMTVGRRVALCVGSGMDVPTIAAALAIEESRLRVEFAHELAHGRAIVQADNLAALSAAAAEGNAAAAKALLAIATKADGPPPGASAIPLGGDATARALRILQGGKK